MKTTQAEQASPFRASAIVASETFYSDFEALFPLGFELDTA
jgi:hypothetical protein